MINETFSSYCCYSLGNPTFNEYPKGWVLLQVSSDNCEVAACHVLSDKRTKSKIKQNCLKELETVQKAGHGSRLQQGIFYITD